MMISPESYRESIKDFNFEQLVKEINKLIKELRRFEKKNDTENMLMMVHPSPEVLYYWNNEYLIKVNELINIKFKEREE